MRWYRGRLQLRAATLVAIASLPLLFLTVASALEHRRHLQHEARARALALVGDLGGEVERLVESTRLILTALAQVPQMTDRTSGACSEFARGLLDDFPQFTNLGAVTSDTRVYCSGLESIGTPEAPAPLEGRASEGAVRTALAQGGFALGGYGRGRESGRVVLPVAFPLDDGNGAVFATMDLTWLGSSILRSGTLPEGAVLVLSTPGGEELARSPADLPIRYLSDPSFVAALGSGSDAGPGALRVRTAQGGHLVAFRFLPSGPNGAQGVLSVAIPAGVAYRIVGEGLARNLFLGSILILLASALAWTGADALIRRPVGRLVSLARRLADGDLAARAETDGTEGELAELGSALDEMASALQTREALLEEAQVALRASEQRFRAIQETSPDAFVLAHAVRRGDGTIEDFRIVYANPMAERLLPPDFESAVGKTLTELSPPIRTDGRLALFARVVETGSPLVEEAFLEGPEGRGVWLRISAVRVEDGVGIAYSDVTERKELEEKLFQAQKLEAVGRLAGGVAHDFNNLLTVIAGTTDLLLMDAGDDGETVEGLQEIQQAASRASDLTSQLLAYSRRQLVQPRVVNLNAIISEMEGMLRRLLGERVILETRLHPGLGSVRIDPGYLTQVVVNLTVNARDAMPRGGRVVLATTEEEVDEEYARLRPEVVPGRYVVLSVEDEGEGIPAGIRNRIFEPFFTTKPRGAGTGLGLSTVYGIVRQSDGHLEVESEEGSGSTFRVRIPRVDEAPVPVESEGEGEIPLGSETVLVVEDDEHVGALVEGILRRFGYRTLSARGAEEALVLSRSHPGAIDLLLTDVVMPGLNGRELADHLVLERPDMAVLFMSGYTDDAMADQGILEEGTQFIGKPFTPERVTRKVRAVLDQ